MMSTTATTSRVRRACVPCKSRKVKCSGVEPRCQQCEGLNLACEYPPFTEKPKRKARRGEIITQYKQKRTNILRIAPKLSLQPAKDERAAPSPIETRIMSNRLLPNTPYDTHFLQQAQADYARNIYPVFPIISPAELGGMISRIYSDRHDAAVVYALLAVTLGHSKGSAAAPQVSRLVELSLENRGALRPNYQVDVRGIMTAVAISSCLVASNHHEMAWVYLREALTMASVLQLDDVSKYASKPLAERAQLQRLYWLLFVHERFMAIHIYRPVLLMPLSLLPEFDPSVSRTIQDGFLQIIKLFRLVDSNFLEVYMGNDSEIEVNEKWFEEKETQLADTESGIESLSEMQQADLIVTQQWLRMLIWQMAMSRYWLSTGISEGCMSLLFPVQIARRLRSLISKCSKESIQVHGSVILRKMFELAIAIADVIILIPAKSLKESAERIDDYMWVANFLLQQSSIAKEQKSVLNEKLQRVSSILPGSPNGGPGTPDDDSMDDPWLLLSRPFMAETTVENNLPLMPNLSYLSEMSQGILSDLDIIV
ncbi:hypothetical protein TRVA0_003S03686 [Trichomonascus vanleenenianus]|uniref:uncharacterized protein n=1 Tax=Trichomonascus vanleenenianus TaxID=2268995 RepID=UPI003ECB919F